MSKVKSKLFDPKEYCQPRVVGDTKIYLHLTKCLIVISEVGENRSLSYAEALTKKRKMSKRDYATPAQFNHEKNVIDTCIELMQWQRSLPLTAPLLMLPLAASYGDVLIAVLALIYLLGTITFLLYLAISSIGRGGKR